MTMKFTPFLVVVLVSLLAASPAGSEPPKETKDGRRVLGEQLLDSLKDDNIVAFAQCWVSANVMNRLIHKDPGSDEFEIRELARELPKRDRLIARQFEPLRDRLSDLTKDLSKLKLEFVFGKIEKVRSMTVSHNVGVLVRVDSDTVVEIGVGRAIKLGDDWYFVGNPEESLKITRQGKSKTVNIVTGKEEVWFSIPPFIIPATPASP